MAIAFKYCIYSSRKRPNTVNDPFVFLPFHTVSVWSSVHVAGTKIHDINPRIGKADDPEKWHDISDAVNKTSVAKIARGIIPERKFREVIKHSLRVCSETELDRKKGKKGPSCWALGFCTAEIVDAIVRNTKVVLPASTYIHVRIFN